MGQVFTDANGNPIQMNSLPPPTSNSQEASDTLPPKGKKKYTDINGNPIDMSRGFVSPPSGNRTVPLAPISDVAPYGTRFLANSLPALGATLAAPEGMGVGSIATGALGAGLGSFVKRGLQAISPKWFGEPPGDTTGDMIDTATDAVGAGVLPPVLTSGLNTAIKVATKGPAETISKVLASRLFRNTTPVQNAVSQDIESGVGRLTTPDPMAIETAAQNVRDNTGVSVAEKYKEGSIGADLAQVPYQADQKLRGISFKKISDRALSDVQQVRNFKLATGEADTIDQLAANRALKQGWSKAGKFDPDAVLAELNDGKNSDVYGEALKSGTKQNLQEFLETAKDMQGDSTSGGHLISMIKRAPVLALPGMALGSAAGGALGHGFIGATVGAGMGITLGESAISKLMANPEIAKLTIQAMKTSSSTQQAGIMSKVILNALRGTEVLVTTPEGQEKAVVGENGQIQYPLRK